MQGTTMQGEYVGEYLAIDFKSGREIMILGDGTDLDNLEGKNLNNLWRKINIIGRKISRKIEVDSGIFMFETNRVEKAGLYMPFTLYIADGQVLTGEIRNVSNRLKKWDKTKPLQVDYWILNGKDITSMVNLDDPTEDLIRLIKATKSPTADPRIEELEQKIRDVLNYDYQSTLDKLNTILDGDLDNLDLVSLENSLSLAVEIDQRQNIVPLPLLEELQGKYEAVHKELVD